MNTCEPDNVLSDNTVKDIESLVGDKIAFIAAFDSNGNPVLLRPASIRQEVINVSSETPLLTTNIDSAAYGGYRGSQCCYWKSGGKIYSFCF